MSEEKTYKFSVAMNCGGCSNAVDRSLKKLDGVQNVDISLEKQTVIVTATADYESVYQQIQKTGKTVKPITDPTD